MFQFARLFSSSLLRQFSPSIFSTSRYPLLPQALPTLYSQINIIIFLTLICTLFIHTCFSSISIINIVSLPDNTPRSDVTEQSYNRSRSAFRGLDGLILRPTCICLTDYKLPMYPKENYECKPEPELDSRPDKYLSLTQY